MQVLYEMKIVTATDTVVVDRDGKITSGQLPIGHQYRAKPKAAHFDFQIFVPWVRAGPEGKYYVKLYSISRAFTKDDFYYFKNNLKYYKDLHEENNHQA